MNWLERRRYRREEREYAKRAAEHREEVEARPEIPHRTGYEYVRCGDRFGMNVGCGWIRATLPSEAADVLRAHVKECPFEAKSLYVPMWSIAWPWHNDEREVAYRNREGDGAPWGLEMAWRPAGTHTLRHSGLMSTSEKPWHLFPELGEAGA